MFKGLDLKRLNIFLTFLFFVVSGLYLALYSFGYVGDDQFRLGLDLRGGSYLVYSADVSNVPDSEISDRMSALRDVIERRVNALGVAEAVVRVETGGFGGEKDYRIVVELPGVDDTQEAIDAIGQTPLLEFRVENPDFDEEAFNKAFNDYVETGDVEAFSNLSVFNKYMEEAVITGEHLKGAQVVFGAGGFTPSVQVNLNKEGAEIFEEVTRENVGKTIAIFLDGQLMSAPVVQQPISGGEAVISGNFTPKEARDLAARLNAGALPIPVELVSSGTVGPYLGDMALEKGLEAAVYSFMAIGVFLLLWYRLLGFVAVFALVVYSVVLMSLFKWMGITLTTTGIAGLIISLGVAVDANILIFERIKEELKAGRTFSDAVRFGFSRAWTSIRDSNLSSIIAVLILFWFGSSIVRGFAIAFGMGVIVSMLSAVFVSRYVIYAILPKSDNRLVRFLWGV